jgi:hypothetical protein
VLGAFERVILIFIVSSGRVRPEFS